MKKIIITIAIAFITTIVIEAQQKTNKTSINRQQAEAITDSLVANFKQLAEQTLTISFQMVDSIKARAIDFIISTDKISHESATIIDSMTSRTANMLMLTQRELMALRDSVYAEIERKK